MLKTLYIFYTVCVLYCTCIQCRVVSVVSHQPLNEFYAVMNSQICLKLSTRSVKMNAQWPFMASETGENPPRSTEDVSRVTPLDTIAEEKRLVTIPSSEEMGATTVEILTIEIAEIPIEDDPGEINDQNKEDENKEEKDTEGENEKSKENEE